MTIELNLVFSQGIYSNVFSLLSRSRAVVETSEDIMSAVLKFLTDNSQVLRDTITNKDLINRIEAADFLSLNEFMSLKYLLATMGVDVLVNEVADMEVNPEAIPEGQIEYIITDDLDVKAGVKLASKYVVSADDPSITPVLEKAIEIGSYFTTPLTEGYKNPLTSAMANLKQTTEYLGQTPESLTNAIESILKYLGKSIFVITNMH